MPKFTTFFVLNGLLNGQVMEFALTAGFEKQMRDGWYFLLDDGNPDGYGPYLSQQHAEKAAEDHEEAEDVED